MLIFFGNYNEVNWFACLDLTRVTTLIQKEIPICSALEEPTLISEDNIIYDKLH